MLPKNTWEIPTSFCMGNPSLGIRLPTRQRIQPYGQWYEDLLQDPSCRPDAVASEVPHMHPIETHGGTLLSASTPIKENFTVAKCLLSASYVSGSFYLSAPLSKSQERWRNGALKLSWRTERNYTTDHSHATLGSGRE